MSAADEANAGDVFRYDRERHHCREGMAIAQLIRGEIRLVDTFWGGMGQDAHWLTEEEAASAVFEFNPSEYRELDRYEGYDNYHPRDRQRITSQHGLQVRRFLKIGATPDLDTQIHNAKTELESAEQKLASAQFAVECRRNDLAELLDGPTS